MGFVSFNGIKSIRQSQEAATLRGNMHLYINDNLMKNFNSHTNFVTFEIDVEARKIGIRFLTEKPTSRKFYKKVNIEKTGISFTAKEVMRALGVIQTFKTNLDFEKREGMLIILTDRLKVFVEEKSGQ